MCKLHLLLHRMESSVTHASFAKKGGRNGKNEIESKSSCLIKKKRKKGPKAIASANNWRANFLENVFQSDALCT